MFKCDECGLCCRRLDSSHLFKELNRGDGVCINLNEEDNKCRIYEARPIQCNVDKFYDMYLFESIERDTYYNLNYKMCKKFKNEK